MVLLAASAPAQTRAVKDGAPSNQLQIDFGLASAVGEIGLTYARLLGAHVEIEAGLGYGFSGTQLSLMPRLAFGSETSRFVCGVGLSVAVPGVDREPNDVRAGASEKIVVPWLNADLAGYEYRSPSGFVFTVIGGTTTSLADGRMEALWENSSAIHLRGYTLPQVRVGFGFAF